MGYLVPEFPAQTHAFFWREVQALRESGVVVHLLSTRRPPPGACRHAFAESAANETRYLFPPSWVQSILHLLTSPLRMASAVRYLLRLDEMPWSKRLLLMPLLLPAAQLCVSSRELRLKHVHVHSCANAAHVAALSCLLGGCNYSLTLHGDLPVYGTDHRQKSERASFVACVTRPLQDQVRKATGLPVTRVPLLCMGVDTARFRDVGARRAVPGALTILTVARLNPAKGHRFALQALAKVLKTGVDAQFLIAGEGPERQNIETEIGRLELRDRVKMLGNLSEDEILSLLQVSDALVLSSNGAGEAAPVSVMEAMACGLPVVCSRIGGTADMIADGVDGFLVEQEDVGGIAARLIQLARDVELRHRMGLEARARAIKEFDCRPLAARLVKLIEGPALPASQAP